MVGAVRSLSFSFDGSYIVGGSDEGNGLEIVSLLLLVRLVKRSVMVADNGFPIGSRRNGRICSHNSND